MEMQRGGKKGVKLSTTQMKLRGFTLSRIESNLYDYCLVSSMHLNQIGRATSTTLENWDIGDTLNRRTLKRTTWKMFSRLIRRYAYTTRQIDCAASCFICKRKNKDSRSATYHGIVWCSRKRKNFQISRTAGFISNFCSTFSFPLSHNPKQVNICDGILQRILDCDDFP